MLISVRVKRPEGTKLFKRNDSRYVYHVVSSVYVPEKKYNRDVKKCIGKLCDDDSSFMWPNENFERYYPGIIARAVMLPEPPMLSDTLTVGTYAVLRHIANQEGLTRILENVYGAKDAGRIFDAMTYLITAQPASFACGESFWRCHVTESGEPASDAALRKLLKVAADEVKRHEMLREWQKAHSGNADMIYLGFIRAGCSGAGESAPAGWGAFEEDNLRPEINLALAVSGKEPVPLDWEACPGSIEDMNACAAMLQRISDCGCRNPGFLLDRECCAESVFRQLDDRGDDFIMRAWEDMAFIRDLISEHAEKLKNDPSLFIAGHDVSGITARRSLFGRERCFHVYYDDVRGSLGRRRFQSRIAALKENLDSLVNTRLPENARLSEYAPWFQLEIAEIPEPEKQIGKDNGRDYSKDQKIRLLAGYALKEEAVRKKLDSYGFFCIVAAKEEDAGKVLDICRGRDNLAGFFGSISRSMDFETPAGCSIHAREALSGKLHLMFLSAILWQRLTEIGRRIQAETESPSGFTAPEIINELEMIACSRASQNAYIRRYALTPRQKTVLKALGLSEQSIDREISSFNLKIAGNPAAS